jgi:pyruvate/2-oxoacid:ferredoxin oxidoreductase beta subunit
MIKAKENIEVLPMGQVAERCEEVLTIKVNNEIEAPREGQVAKKSEQVVELKMKRAGRHRNGHLPGTLLL